jgi:hypothetical protein
VYGPTCCRMPSGTNDLASDSGTSLLRVRAITLCIVCVFIGDLFFETNGKEADTFKPALAAANGNGLGVVIGTNGERFKEAAFLAIDCVLFHGVCFIAFV